MKRILSSLRQGPRRLRLQVRRDQAAAELSGVSQAGGSGAARPHAGAVHGDGGRPRRQPGGSASAEGVLPGRFKMEAQLGAIFFLSFVWSRF